MLDRLSVAREVLHGVRANLVRAMRLAMSYKFEDLFLITHHRRSWRVRAPRFLQLAISIERMRGAQLKLGSARAIESAGAAAQEFEFV